MNLFLFMRARAESIAGGVILLATVILFVVGLSILIDKQRTHEERLAGEEGS